MVQATKISSQRSRTQDSDQFTDNPDGEYAHSPFPVFLILGRRTMSDSKFRKYLLENKLAIDKSKYGGKVPAKAYVILVNHWCHKILLTVAQIAVVIMLCTVFMNVVLRFCFNSGITWAEEIPSLLVTLFTFLACAIGVRDHMHISVTMVYNRFPKGGKMRKFMDVLVDLATLVCGLFMLYYGAMYTTRLMGLPGTLPMTGWPTWIKYAPAPFCGFIMTFDSILFLTGLIKPEDLLYSEPEVDYQELVKQQAAEASANGGNN